MNLPSEAELIEMERCASWFTPQVGDLRTKADAAYEDEPDEWKAVRASRALEVQADHYEGIAAHVERLVAIIRQLRGASSSTAAGRNGSTRG